MKVFLLHGDRDGAPDASPPPNRHDLTQDLELDTLFDAMAAEDEFLRDIVPRVVFASLSEPEEIRYRQQVLADCVANPAVVRDLYAIAVDARRVERKVWFGILSRESPEHILHRSVKILEYLVENLRQLRQIAAEHAGAFDSPGFRRFFAMLQEELDDDYFALVGNHLKELEFPHGVLMSAELGAGNRGVRYGLHRVPHRGWLERIAGSSPPSYGFTVPARDEAGARALGDLQDQGLNVVANALAQSADHVKSFFHVLRAELAFYLGCLNLHERLSAKGAPCCFPEPRPGTDVALTARGLYDVCLALRSREPVAGNDVDADGASLVLITGANQGGKSTFLRSCGTAQLMLQAGMFAPAGSLRADVCTGLFTHFKREEDDTMTKGKLDEELARMSEIADRIRPGGQLLCNESFASTNEAEGSELARRVIRALTESGVKVLFVTHLYDLGRSLHEQHRDDMLFLRAERGQTYRLAEGEPLPTSYGADSYRRVFAPATGSDG
ncbi:DNA mismatch repair protein MutS [Amycolatopsis ultiminotia]|uniref:DNA mismatch repair protein MutS n=1 Tax=Amycolatopsis ultiminotia TaxID=543629 RepID=A0ABP6XJT9_9PSEU